LLDRFPTCHRIESHRAILAAPVHAFCHLSVIQYRRNR
jgi:hypothetical protein